MSDQLSDDDEDGNDQSRDNDVKELVTKVLDDVVAKKPDTCVKRIMEKFAMDAQELQHDEALEYNRRRTS